MDPQKTTVLVVDDEPSIVDAVATSLRYEGYEVETEASGRAAILTAHRASPALIILDVMLPDLDGFESPAGSGPRACTRPCCSSRPRTPWRTRSPA